MATPRVPKNFTTIFEALKVASDSGKLIMANDCESLLSHMAQSAKKSYTWANVDRAMEICDIMARAGLDMNTATYRYSPLSKGRSREQLLVCLTSITEEYSYLNV
jgi:hypothetical protein